MGFQTGLSGLNAASQNLDVIGNNVANASVVGFKSSRTLFADVYAASLNGAGANAIGIGTKVADIQQQFTQGNITVTNNPLDIAINGGGFFRMSDNGTITYSRNGQFHFNEDGYIVNADNLRLSGYGVDASGNIVASAPVAIQLDTADIAPKVTSDFGVGLNLDARATPPTTAVFNPADPTSFTASTSGTVYDSLGNSHVFTQYFVKTATNGQWNLHGAVDGTALANVNLGAGAGNPVVLNFNSSGALTTAMPIAAASLTVAGGAATPLTFALDFQGSTQYGSNFSVNSLTQDGYTSGRLSGFSIAGDGQILGQYSNGQSKTLGQVVLANFANPEGLTPLGNNQWQESADSGLPLIGAPATGNLGALQSAAVEDSNVDLTAELVNMITAQRVYQANAQSIKTQDQVLQTLVNLR
ncbi:MAG TPA: flagellar hook protein FlgE [Burkholderiales bacterium]|nr:flagellar hook protein FlgE [Burkholderiales bacterium]